MKLFDVVDVLQEIMICYLRQKGSGHMQTTFTVDELDHFIVH